jgi:PAS domain S-box-containing protein
MDPTWEQVQAEYVSVWQTLNGRPVESLINLPLMTDPELQAAMQVLSASTPAAYFTNFQLWCLLVCRMVRMGMQHGMSGASAHGCALLGFILGPVFHRYRDAHRFAKLASDLVEKHGFIAYQAKIQYVMGSVAFWTQPIVNAIEFNRAGFRTGTETGDLTFACYCIFQSVTGLLLRNDPLDAVWRESEMALDFARQANYGDAADIIVSQQRFIATMQGRTTTFSTFNDAQFDEATFEAQLTGDRMRLMVCWYWVLKLKARFLSGDYVEALAAADRAKALLWASPAHIQLLDYVFYSALTVAACYENASAGEQQEWRELLAAHREQLHEWVDSYSPTFADKSALVLAEIARLEERDADAMRLYEQAIQSARELGFVQNEGLAHELASRFYAARGVSTIAQACLRNARYCYLRWGAVGKVRQLEQLHPYLRDAPVPASATATIGAPVERLDVGTVLKAAQAVSSEIVLGELVKTLLRIAVEHAGAGRGLLILFDGEEPRIAAEATTGRGQVQVALRETAPSADDLPESMLQYVIRTRESVILDDALAQNPFSADEHIYRKRARSVLCLPLVKQSKLIGVLYLENNLASHVFTPARILVLELLASQAAISLENARLYDDLREREARIRRLVDANIIGIMIWTVDGRILEANEALLGMLTYRREDLVSGGIGWTQLTPAEWVPADQDALAQMSTTGSCKPFEKEYFRKDGSRVPVLIAGALFEWKQDEGVAFVIDMTDRKQAEEKLRASEQRLLDALMELAHVNRVTTMGQLTASIAHEVNQPLAAVVANAEACLSWLDRENPDLDAARRSVNWIIDDSNRASEVIRRIRALARKGSLDRAPLDINGVISETLGLVQRELIGHRVSLRTELASALPAVLGDRVQLQQLIINLVMNGIEAMQSVTDRPRELVVRSRQNGTQQLLVSVTDSGVGISAGNADRLFNAFFTTKPSGMGMGLAICRSIVEAHGGRLSASGNEGPGATFQFVLPLRPHEDAS